MAYRSWWWRKTSGMPTPAWSRSTTATLPRASSPMRSGQARRATASRTTSARWCRCGSATYVHGGQVRKGTSTPYVAHLLAVAATVLEYGGDEDLAIAALLHDSVEDQGGKTRLDDVRNRFGEGVARIVEACSDSLADTGKGERKAHWQERKEAYLAHLRTADEDILWVSLADKVHNARAILRDLRKPDIGDKVWSRFSQPKEKTIGYYRSLADVFCEQLPGQLSNELREIVEVLVGPPLTSAGSSA